MSRDIDIGDGTVDDHKRGIADLDKETKTLSADDGSKDECWERGYVGTINGEPNACNDKDKIERVVVKMKVTKMTDDMVKKMITGFQEVGDAMTSNQLRTVIAVIHEDCGDRGARCTRTMAGGSGARSRLRAWSGAGHTRARVRGDRTDTSTC